MNPYERTWQVEYVTDSTTNSAISSLAASSSSSVAASSSYVRSPYIQGDWSEFVVTYDDFNLQAFNLDGIGIKEEIPEWDL